jgi:hypothetical protein
MERFVFKKTDIEVQNITAFPNENLNVSEGPATESRPINRTTRKLLPARVRHRLNHIPRK